MFKEVCENLRIYPGDAGGTAMMKYPLNSKFSDRITDFVDYKHSLGHSYEESCRILWKFDLFCCDRFPEKSSFDRDIAMAWLEMRDTEGRAGHRNRIMVLREFARYLSAIGDTAYLIPISMTAKSPRYMPHIFTVTEIAAFFYGADHFIPHKDAPARHLVVPVFYRLLYCCGLRPAEARLLRKENVDLVRGVLYIEESKGHKDRTVVVADDLLQLMRQLRKRLQLFTQIARFSSRDMTEWALILRFGQWKRFGDVFRWEA